MLFILKILFVPLLIALVSYAGKRWGHQISGFLTALPIVAGPILLFLALEQGSMFAVAASARALTGMFPLVVFCLLYCVIAKTRSWLPSFGLALIGYGVACWCLLQFPTPPLLPTLGVVYFLLFLLHRHFPKVSSARKPSTITSREIVFRMSAAELLVLVLTALASVTGPNWSGILTPFPIACSTLSIFTHRLHGYDSLLALMRGFFAGFWSFSTFLFSFACLLQLCSLGLAFAGAIAVALSAHALILSRMSKQTNPSGPSAENTENP